MVSQGSGRAQRCSRWEAHWSERGEHGAALPTLLTVEQLVVVHDDGTGNLWPTSIAAWERHACAVAGRNLTRAEWRQYVGGTTYRVTCPGQPGVSGS